MTLRLSRFLRGLLAASFALAVSFAHADTLDTIQKNGVVRIGVFMDYPPFGSIGPDMKPQGYDIEMGEYLARALKAKVEFVPITGENRMAYLATHKADLLLSVGQTPEREKGDRFLAALCTVLSGGVRTEVAGGEDDRRSRGQVGSGGARHARRLEREQGGAAHGRYQAFRRPERRDLRVSGRSSAIAGSRQRCWRNDHRA